MMKNSNIHLLAVAAALCFGVTAQADLHDASLSVYYSFDGDGDVITDHSSYGNHGSIAAGALTRQDGHVGKALLFENTRVDLNGPEFQNKPVDGITIAAWIRHAGSGDPQTLFDAKGTDHGSGLYHAEIRPGGFRWFSRDGSSTTVFNINPGPVLPADEWVHFVGTYDSESGMARTYLNGEMTHEAQGAGKLSDNWDDTAGIGDHNGDRWLTGLLDEYFIFSRALSADEINAVMTGAFTSVDPKGKAAISWAGVKTGR